MLFPEIQNLRSCCAWLVMSQAWAIIRSQRWSREGLGVWINRPKSLVQSSYAGKIMIQSQAKAKPNWTSKWTIQQQLTRWPSVPNNSLTCHVAMPTACMTHREFFQTIKLGLMASPPLAHEEFPPDLMPLLPGPVQQGGSLLPPIPSLPCSNNMIGQMQSPQINSSFLLHQYCSSARHVLTTLHWASKPLYQVGVSGEESLGYKDTQRTLIIPLLPWALSPHQKNQDSIALPWNFS